MVEWYENIPESGVLCKLDDEYRLIKSTDISEDGELFAIDKAGNEFYPEDLTPLTAAEIMAFITNLEPVAWNINDDHKFHRFGATYNHKHCAIDHIASYADTQELFMIPLYAIPTGDL